MIVRILGEGQYRVPDGLEAEMNAVDDRVQAAADAGDDRSFQIALSDLVDLIHERGDPLPAQEFVGSDAIVPAAGTTLAEAQQLLSTDGLIPD